MPTTARHRPDACPGVFDPHDAADGALARVRLPGGVASAAVLRVLAGCADDLGDGSVHLTSRGNLQLRGTDRTDPRLAARLTAAGLLPSPAHERVRNVLASPLSGVRGGLADVRGLAGALDRAVCARPALAALPGRFLFAVDDGRGDVAAEEPDVCWRAVGPDRGALLVAGGDTGVRATRSGAADLLARAAGAFLALREADGGTVWRARELSDAAARIAALLPDGRAAPDHAVGSTPAVHHAPPVGPVRRDDGGWAMGVAPVLGVLTADQLRLLASSAPGVLLTPWRTVFVPEGAPDRSALAAAGLVGDPLHPAARVSACAGRPGCAKALRDVRRDVRLLMDTVADSDPSARPVHVTGCERRCGAPRRRHIDVVATDRGYRVDGVEADLGAALRGTSGGTT